MNKVYFLGANESWICDRFKQEWDEDNSDISVQSPYDADVIWLNANWCWKRLPVELLQNRKVITTIHHIVPEKFDSAAQADFNACDKITDVYHVYNERMLSFIQGLTDKPIYLIKYWCNQKIFQRSSLSKEQLRDKHGLPLDAFICGSFQRDTEGLSIANNRFEPKLEKGADLFADALHKMKGLHPNLHVLLTAWRRQYVIKRLVESKIPYSYFELPKHNDLIELYQCLDLYMITARCEGGPQAGLECGVLGIPVVSTPVGIAEQILPSTAINWDVTKATPAIPNVSSQYVPGSYKPYRDLIQLL